MTSTQWYRWFTGSDCSPPQHRLGIEKDCSMDKGKKKKNHRSSFLKIRKRINSLDEFQSLFKSGLPTSRDDLFKSGFPTSRDGSHPAIVQSH